MTQTERRARSGGPDVRIVDDEDDIRELLELSLLRLGLASDGAASLAEARRLLGEKRYRLCLTDMRLPDGDGLELVRYISDNVRDLPVAVITAFGSMDNAVTALKAGAFDYLSKPVSIEQLRALVKSVFSASMPSAVRVRLPRQHSMTRPSQVRRSGVVKRGPIMIAMQAIA